MNPALRSILAAAGCAPLALATATADWTPLFNGRDLSGWKVVNGKAPYSVEDGAICGTTVTGSPNSFLATENTYGDFILEYEVLMEKDKTFNSGVQFRSIHDPKIQNGRVHGYQCEIDPSPRGWTAGIYDEARRGWLYPVNLNPPALNGFKVGEWNQFRIEAIGNTIRTWLNDKPVAHLVDDMTPQGIIALQVHAIGNKDEEGRKIKWRKLRIQTGDLKPAPPTGIPVKNMIANNLTAEEQQQGWKLLWDGKTTAGWRSARGKDFPAKGWSIKDGILTVQESGGGEATNGGDIVTVEQYSDFELVLDFRYTAGANSGIKYFVQPDLNQTGGSAIGTEFQILDDAKHPDAKAGRDGNRTLGSLYDLIPAPKNKPATKPGEWHTARILAKGKHVEHWLDGQKLLEYDRGTPEFRKRVGESKYKVWPGFGDWEKGHILLQDHGNTVSFRSLKIRPL